MKTFKSFLGKRLEEVLKPKAKGEKDFFDAHKVDVTDPEDQGANSAKVTTKNRSGKRPADKNQAVGEEAKYTNPGLEKLAQKKKQAKAEGAENAYKTIKAKAKNEEHELLLIALYDELHENNKDALLEKLDEDYDRLIEFGKSVAEE
jgi:hypothetical protein